MGGAIGVGTNLNLKFSHISGHPLPPFRYPGSAPEGSNVHPGRFITSRQDSCSKLSFLRESPPITSSIPHCVTTAGLGSMKDFCVMGPGL